MAEQKKKYIVAPGASFVGNRKTYKEGDEIDETAFKDKARFESFTKGKTPKIISGGGNDNTGNDEEVTTSLTREELEKLALELGMRLENIAKLDDSKLKKILKKNGKLN
jgi:hypothetical protein